MSPVALSVFHLSDSPHAEAVVKYREEQPYLHPMHPVLFELRLFRVLADLLPGNKLEGSQYPSGQTEILAQA